MYVCKKQKQRHHSHMDKQTRTEKDAQTHWTEQQTDVGSTSTAVTRRNKKEHTDY